MSELILKQPEKPPGPDGAWSLEALHGTKDGVIKAIGNSDIPLHWKTVLTAELSALKPEFNFVTVNAHLHNENGMISLHISIKPASVLT